MKQSLTSRSVLHLRLVGNDLDAGGRIPAPSLADFCRRTTPHWELSSRGAFLDLTGTERLYGRGLDGAAFVCRLALDHLALENLASNLPTENNRGPLAVGTGPTRLAAGLASLIAARCGGGVLAVVPDQVSVFLQPFPVNFLPARRSVVHRLRQLGVRTLGDLQVVPRSLLGSVFGPDGRRLVDEASGYGTGVISADLGTAPQAASGLELVVGVRLHRPVSSARVVSALCRGLAVRALTCCSGSPASRGRWRLTAKWAAGSGDSVSTPGPCTRGWQSWLGLVDLLWKKLPHRRQGLLALELRAESSGPVLPRQGSLFAAHEADGRLEDVLRLSGKHTSARLGPASEGLLVSRGAVWYGPGAGMSKPGQGCG
jgi:hypothetical protein